MKNRIAGLGMAALIAAGGAQAWEEPDATFAKFHEAVKSGNAEEMVRLSTSARRGDMSSRKDAELREAQAATPAAFALEQKTVSRDGQAAKLYLSAPGDAFSPARAGAQYGIVRLALEAGEWRITGETWAREKPVELLPARSPASNASGAERPRMPAAQAQPKAPVLRLARPACTYKGVMSDEEIERCR
ncbi:MAG TPA: hypothetical protein VHN19_17205 [Burkholderiales bacterium]|jgi:hypothetical protein|nr:hypothetical protein [Burkholderiales bacterium]